MKYYFNEKDFFAVNSLIDALDPSNIFILTDDHTKRYCLPVLESGLKHEFTNVNIRPGDASKNLDVLSRIWRQLMDKGADRKSLLINLGGGVITDIGGFAASTFKRGMKFIHIPTSLLGMVDAAIGGKNGINFQGHKNQIGTIVSPETVWINSGFLKTLPQEEFDSGFAEMLKHGLIADASYWHDLTHYYFNKEKSLFNDLIRRSVAIKDQIISEDPKEQNIRKLLNFGHTLGHGIESYMNYHKNHPVSHGHAVAVGMVLAAYLSHKLKNLPLSDVHEIKNVINKIYPKIFFDEKDMNSIVKLLQHDKKNVGGKVLFVLLDKIGQANFDNEVPENYIYEAFSYYYK